VASLFVSVIMDFGRIKQHVSIIIAILVIFVEFIAPVCSREINANSYAGKVIKSENHLIDLEWWDNFNSPVLKSLIEQSLDNCFDVKIAGMKAEEAQNYVESSNRNFFPSALSGLGHLSSKYSTSFDLFGNTLKYDGDDILGNFVYLPLKASYEPDFFGKSSTIKEYFQQNKDLQEFEKRLIMLNTVTEVSSLYFNIVKNRKLIDLYQETHDLKKQKFDIDSQKYELALIPKNQLLKTEKELQQSEELLLTMKALNEELKNSLNLLVFGDKEKNEINFETLDSLNLFYDADIEVSTEKIAYRPDILAAEKRIKMAKLDADLMKKELFPSISLRGEILHMKQRYGDLAIKSGAFSFAPWVFYKLFEKGKNTSELKAKKNIYRQMLANYEKTIISSINDVNNSIFYLKTGIKNLNNAKRVSGLDMEYIDILKQKLDMDLITCSEYIEAREQLIKSQIAECESKTQCLIHAISLYKALGGNV